MEAKLIKTEKGYYLDTGSFDGIHLACYPHDVTKQRLSIKNCQAIERGYDLDELAEKCSIDWHGEIMESSCGIYKEGFQKALELMSDKKFSEEDVRKAIEIARNGSMQEQHNGYGRPTELRFVLDNISSDEIIQSLQQTEWKVEIVMINSRTGKIIKSDFDLDADEDGLCDRAIPKIDTDGCLILKLKSE